MSGHRVALRLYLGVFAALIALTGLTVWVAFIDLGPLNTVVALAIAIVKALLVIFIFMHIQWSSRLTQVIAASGFFWLLIAFFFVLADYLTRTWDYLPKSWV